MDKLFLDVTEISLNNQQKNAQHASRFNLFQILNITTDEVRLHSKFLAEILNPLGSHDQGTLFLDQFLELINCSQLFKDSKKVRVFVEKFIGPKTETTGGRIDILLIDNQNCALIIENKIYAGDQENQLLRYFNFGEQLIQKNGRYELIYLTLFGNSASDYSHGEVLKKDDYQTISYNSDILRWLENCIIIMNETPKLAVAIAHYRQLIENLTGNNMNKELEQEIIDRIKKDQNSFETASSISSVLTEAKFQLLNSFGKKLETAILNSDNSIKAIYISEYFGKKWCGVELFLEESGTPENRPPHIRLSFLSETNDCYIEIHPGIIDNVIQDKNHDKRIKYASILNDYFTGVHSKVLNTENYWQGVWVCHYSKLNNRFSELIETEDQVLQDVLTDLNFIIEHFDIVERGINE